MKTYPVRTYDERQAFLKEVNLPYLSTMHLRGGEVTLIETPYPNSSILILKHHDHGRWTVEAQMVHHGGHERMDFEVEHFNPIALYTLTMAAHPGLKDVDGGTVQKLLEGMAERLAEDAYERMVSTYTLHKEA